MSSTQGETERITLLKNGHAFVFNYMSGDEDSIMETMVREAANPNSPLDWRDVAAMNVRLGIKAGLRPKPGDITPLEGIARDDH